MEQALQTWQGVQVKQFRFDFGTSGQNVNASNTLTLTENKDTYATSLLRVAHDSIHKISVTLKVFRTSPLSEGALKELSYVSIDIASCLLSRPLHRTWQISSPHTSSNTLTLCSNVEGQHSWGGLQFLAKAAGAHVTSVSIGSISAKSSQMTTFT